MSVYSVKIRCPICGGAGQWKRPQCVPGGVPVTSAGDCIEMCPGCNGSGVQLVTVCGDAPQLAEQSQPPVKPWQHSGGLDMHWMQPKVTGTEVVAGKSTNFEVLRVMTEQAVVPGVMY